jgi:hypothetical protein
MVGPRAAKYPTGWSFLIRDPVDDGSPTRSCFTKGCSRTWVGARDRGLGDAMRGICRSYLINAQNTVSPVPRQRIDRSLADAVSRTHFGAFTYAAFKAPNPGQRLVPNWHIDAVCYQVQQMVNGETRRRLNLNLPPRTLKSFIASVTLPAWLLGRDPSARIIAASYSDDLAGKFSRDCRALLETPFYRRVFPGTKFNPKKASEGEFETTKRNVDRWDVDRPPRGCADHRRSH